MALGIGPLGQRPLSSKPVIPARAFVPRNGDRPGDVSDDASRRSGTRDGLVVAAGRRIDAFAAQAEFTEQQSATFDAASAGFLAAVAAIRSERLGGLQAAQKTQLALEDFALRIDALELSQQAGPGTALTALVSELQQVLDTAFSRPAAQDRAPQIFFPRLDDHGVTAERLFSAYQTDASGEGLPPDSSIDTVA